MDLQDINQRIEDLKREKARYTCSSEEASALRACVDVMIQVFERIRYPPDMSNTLSAFPTFVLAFSLS